jgi:hypothetical protein
VVALVIVGVTAALALFLAYRYHLGVAAILVAILGGLPGLYLAWSALPGGPGSPDLAVVADQLAVAVGEQWRAEANLRRLNDPYPLPVSWAAADPSLTDSWESLVKLAGTGAGWPSLPPAGIWAAGPDDLAGAGGDLVEVLSRVPTGRLVVLGEPGAGKTMLMVRLMLDLLARRAAGGPVPILASVGSWNPAKQDLRGWLAAQLVIDQPALANSPSANTEETTQAAALLAAGLIVPILDGLDEIPEDARGPAISRINDAFRPGEQLLVTCRSQQYRSAVRPEAGVEVTLRGAAAVQLRPLDADDVGRYLCDDAAGPVARARWGPVLKVLGTETPAGQALATPLMVGLARAIYNPRPGELAGALRDPAELCDPVLTDRAGVESLLFDAFIPAAYRHDPVGRWTAHDTQKWLVFLAHHLERNIAGPDLAWWQLPLAAPNLAPWIGLVAAGVAGAGAVIGIATGVVAGGAVGVGVVAGVVVGAGVVAAVGPKRSPKPAHGIRWKSPRRGVLVVGVAIAVVAGLLFRASGLGNGSAAAAGAGLGILAGFGSWLITQEGAPLDISSAASPPVLLARDRRTAITIGAGVGSGLLAAFILFGVVTALVAGHALAGGAEFGVFVGAGFAIAVGAGVAFKAAWPYYEIARIWLTLHRRLPWPLMAFLADAHRRGVLRQAGAVYQFRHIELQHRLATRP